MPLRGETARRFAVAVAALSSAAAAGALGAPFAGQAAAGLFGAALFAFALRIPDAPASAPPAPRLAGLEPGLGRAALDRLPFPLLLIDPAGLIEYANPAAQALFERLRVGEHHSMSFRAPDFLDALAEAQAGGPPRSFDFTLHGDRNRVI
ncbi:MAG: PAS domain-containing protein, partial [Albimonas sp.]|uniref:PAS domain-containing protein n=1 Tax=Albimonas sp. TaxID=1872425 RepID=UPI004055C496